MIYVLPAFWKQKAKSRLFWIGSGPSDEKPNISGTVAILTYAFLQRRPAYKRQKAQCVFVMACFYIGMPLFVYISMPGFFRLTTPHYPIHKRVNTCCIIAMLLCTAFSRKSKRKLN